MHANGKGEVNVSLFADDMNKQVEIPKESKKIAIKCNE